METQVGDIVWAKVPGYPDWPGVVSNIEERNATVYFIGDLTHIVTDVEKLKAFNTQMPNTENKWLMESYKAAIKMNKPITFDKLSEVNRKILAKVQPKQQKRQREDSEDIKYSNLEERIRNLHIKLNSQISSKKNSDELKRQRLPVLIKKADILNSFTIISSQAGVKEKYSAQDMISVFDKLISLEISLKIFKSTKLIKTLKEFKCFLETNPDLQVQKLVKTTKMLLNYWKKLIAVNEILRCEDEEPDIQQERKKVKLEFLKVLEAKGIVGVFALDLFKKIDKKLKEVDPQREEIYLAKTKSFMKELKLSRAVSVDSLFNKLYCLPNDSE